MEDEIGEINEAMESGETTRSFNLGNPDIKEILDMIALANFQYN